MATELPAPNHRCAGYLIGVAGAELERSTDDFIFALVVSARMPRHWHASNPGQPATPAGSMLCSVAEPEHNPMLHYRYQSGGPAQIEQKRMSTSMMKASAKKCCVCRACCSEGYVQKPAS